MLANVFFYLQNGSSFLMWNLFVDFTSWVRCLLLFLFAVWFVCVSRFVFHQKNHLYITCFEWKLKRERKKRHTVRRNQERKSNVRHSSQRESEKTEFVIISINYIYISSGRWTPQMHIFLSITSVIYVHCSNALNFRNESAHSNFIINFWKVYHLFCKNIPSKSIIIDRII